MVNAAHHKHIFLNILRDLFSLWSYQPQFDHIWDLHRGSHEEGILYCTTQAFHTLQPGYWRQGSTEDQQQNVQDGHTFPCTHFHKFKPHSFIRSKESIML